MSKSSLPYLLQYRSLAKPKYSGTTSAKGRAPSSCCRSCPQGQAGSQLKKSAANLPGVWTLGECLKRADSNHNWQIEQQIIEDYFKIGAAQLTESALLKELDSPLAPEEKFARQCRLIEVIKQRYQAAASLCCAINLHPGHPLKVDFVLPERVEYPELPPLAKWENAVATSPYLKHLPEIERLKIFHVTYAGMIASKEKYDLCRKNQKFPEAAAAYADYCTMLHQLCRLAGIQVEKSGTALLHQKVIVRRPAQ